MKQPERENILIGATKTIGNYVLFDTIESYLDRENIHFELIIDNTKNLLKKLDAQKLDFLIIEGYFDKSQYDYQLFQKDELVGICAKNHPFAGKEIELDSIFSQHLIIREEGSGTRKVFENFLTDQNMNLRRFERVSIISSLSVIEKMIEKNKGISFVYQVVPEQNEYIATFRIKNHCILHEFNYVFLKNSCAKEKLTKL